MTDHGRVDQPQKGLVKFSPKAGQRPAVQG